MNSLVVRLYTPSHGQRLKKCTSYSYNQHAKVEGTQKQRRESKPCQVPTENPAISLEFGIAF